MSQLMEELASTEGSNRVGFARQAYNDAVMTYNNARETFPGTLVTPAARPPAQLFEIEAGSSARP